jgi:glycosyltransferase involved in cell wall biosynthesis
MNNPLISICIPAYKHPEYLKRLLDSISVQTFKDFQVIVTDDSPGDEVKELCESYRPSFSLLYHKNQTPKGTPENWNEAIRLANGQWIKLMHDDDWFSSANSLQSFVNIAMKDPQASFIFCAYQNVYEGTDRVEQVRVNSFRMKKLLAERTTLFASNVIGPPSVTMVRYDQTISYDKRMKWLVDIDFYTRYLNQTAPVYIDEMLINVGINENQVTKSAFRKPEVEIPENFLFLEKTGVQKLKNVMVYDAWWRSVRNLHICDTEFIRKNGYSGEIPLVIRSMISWQKKLPRSFIKTGVISKFFMFCHYLLHRRSLK